MAATNSWEVPLNNKVEQVVPQARKDGLVVEQLSDEVLVYDLDGHQAHCLNQTAALVWEHCDGKTTVPEIARLIGRESKSPVDEEVAWLALDQLGKARLLSDRVTRPSGAARMSRRTVMRRIGLASAVALPVVTSILAPTAEAAVNCVPSGQPCTSSAQCCSGLCNQGSCV